MNKNQIVGKAEQVKGAIKATAGKTVGNDRLRTKGQLEQATGRVREQIGDAEVLVKQVTLRH